MPHDSNIVYCAGPDSPHAFDMVALQPRNGALDALCPKCRGHGAWNAEIDLTSFRCRRAICDRCNGAGWVETGDDLIAVPDIAHGPNGEPRWTTRYLAKEEASDNGLAGPSLRQKS
jgi:hypothetical protein